MEPVSERRKAEKAENGATKRGRGARQREKRRAWAPLQHSAKPRLSLGYSTLRLFPT